MARVPLLVVLLLILCSLGVGGWMLYEHLRPHLASRHALTAFSMSPDGRTVAVGNAVGEISIWDVETGTLAARFKRDASTAPPPGHPGTLMECRVTGLALMPDGRSVAATFSLPNGFDAAASAYVENVGMPLFGWLHALVLLDAETGRIRWSADQGPYEAGALALRPDGKVALVGRKDESIRSSSMQAGAALWPPAIPESQGDRREVLALAFAPDGSRAVASIGQVGTCKTLWMLDAATGKALFEVNRGHASSANALAFTPDGKLIAAATGGPAESVSESSAMTRVEWRYDSVSDCSVTFYDAADGTVVRRLTGYQQPVMAVAFSADGKRVLSAERGGALLLHEVSTGSLIRRMALRSYDVAGLAFLPDGRRALVAGGNTYEGHGVLLLVDTESGEQLRAFDAPEPE